MLAELLHGCMVVGCTISRHVYTCVHRPLSCISLLVVACRQTWAGVVKEWKQDRVLLSLAFEHRHVSLCGRAFAAFAFAVWQQNACLAASEFWAGNAAHRLLLRWQANVARRTEVAAQTSQASCAPASRVPSCIRNWAASPTSAASLRTCFSIAPSRLL